MKLWPVSMSVPGSGDFFVDSSQRHRMSTKQGQVRIEYAVTVGHPLMKKSILADSSLLQLHFKLLVECCDDVQKKHTKSGPFQYGHL